MKIKRIICAAMAVMMAVISLSGCFSQEAVDKLEISGTLSIDCSQATVVDKYDSHGGFHGDGTSCVVLQFEDSSQAEKISGSGQWNPLPMTDTLTAAVWGKDIGDTYYASLITKDNDWEHPLIPPVTSGWYFFLDRHSDSADRRDDTRLYSRYSFNFTVAIYDSDADRLYFAECDT